MADGAGGWSHVVHPEPDGTCRVEVVDEDGVSLPVAREVSPKQAQRLIERIAEEAHSEGRPIREVIRDPAFMAATVITVKRLPK